MNDMLSGYALAVWRTALTCLGLRTCREGCLALIASLTLIACCHADERVTINITDGRSDEMYKLQLEHLAMLKVEAARAACGLNDEQVQKLRKAASGDVNRLMHEMNALRHATEHWDTGTVNGMRTLSELMQSFRSRVEAGLHERGSLFAKYLEHGLDESQKKRYQEYLVTIEKQRQRVFALSTVEAINERVPLLKAQREKLIELIENSPLPKVDRNTEITSGYLRLARVSERDLAEFLDEAQVKYILRICEPYKRWRPQ